MRSILVVDDMAVFREPIAATLSMAGYDTAVACDGEEALRKTRIQRPDLILLDMAMPNMDGISFLKALRADPHIAKTQVILLTAMSDKKFVLAAAPYGVKDYILKSRFRLQDLLDRIRKLDQAAALAAAAEVKADAESAGQSGGRMLITDAGEVRRLLTRDKFLKKLEVGQQGKTLSGVVVEVISMASAPNTDMGELAALIARDMTLSARILHVANSATYASAATAITNIPDALRKVGCSTVRKIAATLGVFDCMPAAGPDGFNPVLCWRHSFAVAQVCEQLVRAAKPEDAGLAYIIGLCHDLGDIYIRTQYGKEYQEVTEAAARTGRPRDQLYGLMLGMTPVQMISAVLKSNGLPEPIREPIELLYAHPKMRSSHTMSQILWMAENYVNADLLASSPMAEVAPMLKSLCKALVGSENPAGLDPVKLRADAVALVASLGKLSKADEAKLLAPMFAAATSRIWVARDPAVSEFNPVELALESMAKIVVHERLPSDQEAGEVDGLVVIASNIESAGFAPADIEAALAPFRKEGRDIPTLALSCEPPPEDAAVSTIPYRTSIALSDLAEFSESAVPKAKAEPAKAAA